MGNIRHKNSDVRYEVFLCLTVMSVSFLFYFEKNSCLFLSLCVLSFFKYIQIKQTCWLILRLADCTGRNITLYLWKWVVSHYRKNINVYWFFFGSDSSNWKSRPLCGSFRRAAPFVEHLQNKKYLLSRYKRKRSKDFFTYGCFCHTGVMFEQY